MNIRGSAFSSEETSNTLLKATGVLGSNSPDRSPTKDFDVEALEKYKKEKREEQKGKLKSATQKDGKQEGEDDGCCICYSSTG